MPFSGEKEKTFLAVVQNRVGNILDRRRRERQRAPRRMMMRHGEEARSASAAFSAQNASGGEYRQGLSRVIERSRKKGFAERSRVKRR